MLTLYQNFMLKDHSETFPNGCRYTWFRSATPISWDEARERIMRHPLAPKGSPGGYGPGQWMLSVDPADFKFPGQAPPLPL